MPNNLSTVVAGGYTIIAPAYRRKYLEFETLNAKYIRVKSNQNTNFVFECFSVFVLLLKLTYFRLRNRKVIISDLHRFVLNKKFLSVTILRFFNNCNILWWNGMAELAPYKDMLEKISATNFIHEDAFGRCSYDHNLKLVPYLFTPVEIRSKHPCNGSITLSFVGLMYNDKDIAEYGVENFFNGLDDLVSKALKDKLYLTREKLSCQRIKNELHFRVRNYQIRCATIIMLLSEYKCLRESRKLYFGGRVESSAIDAMLLKKYPVFAYVDFKVPYAKFLEISSNSSLVLDFGSKAFYAYVYPRTQVLNSIGCNIVTLNNLFEQLEAVSNGSKKT